MDIGLLMLFVLGSIGILFVLCGIYFKNKDEKAYRRCTAKETGTVTGYSFWSNNGIRVPIVTFYIDGQSYESKLKYRTVIVTSSSFRKQTEVIGDKFSPTLRVKRNSILSFNPMESLFPRGTSMKVYYNPDNPNESYVQRPVISIMPTVFKCTGAGIILLGVLLWVLV